MSWETHSIRKNFNVQRYAQRWKRVERYKIGKKEIYQMYNSKICLKKRMGYIGFNTSKKEVSKRNVRSGRKKM